MPARVTDTQVEAILLREFEEGDDLEPFIAIATSLTDWVEDCSDPTLSDDSLENIELQLAAHFYAQANQRFADKATDKASAKFQGTTGMRLDYTDYGQNALLLDTSGCLAKRNKEASQGKTTPQIVYLGDLD